MTENLQKHEAYKIMQQTQEKLHSKYMMSAALEECFNQNFLENFQKEFISQNTIGKQYYTRILLMSKHFNSKKHPFAEYKIYEAEKGQAPIFEIPAKLNPTYDGFASIFIDLNNKNALDPKLIDLITYSLIPSFYLMFLEKSSFMKFVSFITELKDDYDQNSKFYPLHYLFSRSLFVSPIFLVFVRKVLHNILQPVYGNDKSNISISRIKQQIISSFEENIHHIPSFMLDFFLYVNDTYNFLDNCLFEPLLENPTIFLVVDFNVVSNTKMMEFKDVLKSVFDEKLKQEITDIVDNNKKSEKAIFVPKSGQEEQISDQTKFKVINSIDQIAIKIIMDKINDNNNNNSNNNNNDNSINSNNSNDNNQNSNKSIKNSSDINSQILGINYEIYKALFMKEKISEQLKFLNDTILTKKSNNWMYLRYILKNAQPLPVAYDLTDDDDDDDVVNGQSFADMVKNYVVDSFGPDNIVDAYIALEQYRTDLEESFFVNPFVFQTKMDSLVTNHDEQEKAMQMISRFNKELHYLKEKMKVSISLMQQTFLVYLIDLYEIDKAEDLTEIPTRAIDIITNPHYYVSAYQKYISRQAIKAMNLTGNDCTNILCGHFYQNLDFYSYLSFRSDLNKFDELASQCCQKYLKISFTEERIQKIYNKIHDMTIYNEFYKELNYAFEMNGDLISKSKAISNSILNIFAAIQSSNDVFGEDERTPLRFYIFSLINPPHLISNIVFLYEYLYYNTTEAFISDDFPQYKNIIESITNSLSIFTKFPILRLVRTRRKRCELFITGNDSEMIVDLLNKTLTLFKGSVAMNHSDKTRVAKYIDDNEDNILSFDQGACYFNTNILNYNFDFSNFKNIQNDEDYKRNISKFNYYVEINIHVGSKIKLNQVLQNKKYDLRFAVYCRNKDAQKGAFKKASLNADIKNFVENDGIDNSMKIILLNKEDEKFKQPGVKIDSFDNFIKEFYNIINEKWQQNS